jgi:hypothetical protein
VFPSAGALGVVAAVVVEELEEGALEEAPVAAPEPAVPPAVVVSANAAATEPASGAHTPSDVASSPASRACLKNAKRMVSSPTG